MTPERAALSLDTPAKEGFALSGLSYEGTSPLSTPIRVGCNALTSYDGSRRMTDAPRRGVRSDADADGAARAGGT